MKQSKISLNKLEDCFIIFVFSFRLSVNRTKSTSELDGPEVNGTANQEERTQFAVSPFFIRPELGDLTRKNWTYLTNEVNKL